MEKIGIFGGSFNPPHLGHVHAARYAALSLGLDRLMLIPSGKTPCKPVPELTASPEQRIKMLSIAFGSVPIAEVSSMELDRGGESYTWETVRQIREGNPEAELFLLLGTDMFRKFPQWADADKLLETFRALRFDPAFPKGANVNFYQLLGDGEIRILTFERGVEGYTRACGTGCGSVALVLWKKGLLPGGVLTAHNMGGTLKITIDGENGNVTSLLLEGPTEITKIYDLDI